MTLDFLNYLYFVIAKIGILKTGKLLPKKNLIYVSNITTQHFSTLGNAQSITLILWGSVENGSYLLSY